PARESGNPLDFSPEWFSLPIFSILHGQNLAISHFLFPIMLSPLTGERSFTYTSNIKLIISLEKYKAKT
ncbi:MAG: hypothetical protein AAB726_02460, partial [Patescibacteria group bacterium]